MLMFFGLSLPALTVTDDVGSTATLGGTVMNLCIGYEQASASLLLLVRDPRSVFPLDNNKHVKNRLARRHGPVEPFEPEYTNNVEAAGGAVKSRIELR